VESPVLGVALSPLVPPPMRARVRLCLLRAMPGAVAVPSAVLLAGAPAVVAMAALQSASVALTAMLRLQLVVIIPLAGAGSMRTPPTASRPPSICRAAWRRRRRRRRGGGAVRILVLVLVRRVRPWCGLAPLVVCVLGLWSWGAVRVAPSCACFIVGSGLRALAWLRWARACSVSPCLRGVVLLPFRALFVGACGACTYAVLSVTPTVLPGEEGCCLDCCQERRKEERAGARRPGGAARIIR
jgi:hypothetical protein